MKMNQNQRKMQRTRKPIIEQTLAEKADQRHEVDFGRNMSGLAGWMVNVGIVVSAFLTVIYLMLLVDGATNLTSPYGLLLGLLVGVVAIIPAEMALMVWQIRLRSERSITRGQRIVAVVGMVLAGLFSALTTSSFFSHFLSDLFPKSYIEIAPLLNVGAIVGSWIVFIMTVVTYGIFSRWTQQNLAEATAYQSVFDARMTVLRSAGEAIRIEADTMINDMDKAGVFALDARNLILSSLGMDEERVVTPVDMKDLGSPPPALADNSASHYIAFHNGERWQRVGGFRPLADAQTALVDFAASDPDMLWAISDLDGNIVEQIEPSVSHPNGSGPD